MSVIVKYSNGSTYTLVANKVEIEKVQDLDGQYHIPYTSIVGMMRLGLGVQKITVSGDSLDMSACLWHDVVAISFDSGTSYQTVYFAGVPYSSDCWSGIYPYALSLLASPLKEQTAVRYPTSTAAWYWGNVTSASMSQAGNVNAYPVIHYLAPLFYAPLSNTLLDFAGQAVTFTRTAPKTHNDIVYPINTPIFDSGLYLASDTAQDVATWTPPASTVRTVALQIKRGIPKTNLAPNGEFETNITGWGSGGTLSRETSTPIVGTGSLKLVASGGSATTWSQSFAVIAGHKYLISILATSTAAAGRKVKLSGYDTNWASSATISVDCSVTQAVSVYFTPATSQIVIYCELDSYVAGESLLIDNVVCYDLTATPDEIIWHNVQNNLYINYADGLIYFSDGSAWVGAVFPVVDYLRWGQMVEVVVIDDTSHAVAIAVRSAISAWTSASGTLAALAWPQLTLGNLEGSIANLVEYPYVLTAAEYQALAYSSLSLLYNTLYIGNRYAGEIVKGSDKRLLNAAGSDISALLGGTDIAIGASAVTIAQLQGLSARWWVELKRTDV